MLKLIKRIEWRYYKWQKKRRLVNKDISLIATNCNAGMIYHDLGLFFNSPFINAGIYIPDMIRFLKRPDFYLQADLAQITERDGLFIGKIADLSIRFLHYKSFDEAIQKWNTRRTRLNLKNFAIFATDRDGYTSYAMSAYDDSFKAQVPKNAGEADTCTYEEIKLFNELPVAKKVIFTSRPYPEFESAYQIKGFENEIRVPVLSDFKPGFWRRRYIDDFDYVAFLNGVSVPELNAARNN